MKVLLRFDLKIADIKQYFYCPRVVYFTYCLPVDKKVTYKMKHGRFTHDVVNRLEKRRTFGRYELAGGERLFHVQLYSKRLGLSGVLDMLIKSGSRIIPVEFKYTESKISINHRLQLAGYALLLEDSYKTKINFGFVYLIPQDKVIKVAINAKIKEQVLDALDAIRKMIVNESMPEPATNYGKCIDCEYLRYCGDRF